MANIIHGKHLPAQAKYHPIILLDTSSYDAIYSTIEVEIRVGRWRFSARFLLRRCIYYHMLKKETGAISKLFLGNVLLTNLFYERVNISPSWQKPV